MSDNLNDHRFLIGVYRGKKKNVKSCKKRKSTENTMYLKNIQGWRKIFLDKWKVSIRAQLPYGWINRSMRHNGEPRNKLLYLWWIDLWQMCQDNSKGKKIKHIFQDQLNIFTEKGKNVSYFTSLTKINSNCVINLRINTKITKLLEKSIWNNI